MKMNERIKQQRLQAGLTQEELAEKLGLQKSAIAKYEKGRVENIKRSTIERMANIFGCDPAWLMGYEDDSEVSPAMQDLITEAEKASDEDIERATRLLAYINELRNKQGSSEANHGKG